MGEKVPHAILNSWRRCQATGLDPDKLDFADPVELDLDNELVQMAHPVIEHYRPVLSDTKAVLILLDEQARLLLRCEGDAQLARAYDRAKAIPGVCYSEDLLGTTAGGTALLARRPVRVAGSEHHARRLYPFTATGVPILDPLTGHARGVLTISCRNENEHPAMGRLAREIARAIEQRFLERSTARERTLFEAYLRTGDVPRLRPPEETGPLLRELTGTDHLLLEEKAAELIAYGKRAAVEVALSHGRVATLRSLPRTEPVGVVGVVAQVRIEGGPWRELADASVQPEPALLERPSRPLPAAVNTGNRPVPAAMNTTNRPVPAAVDTTNQPALAAMNTPVPAASPGPEPKPHTGTDPWLFLFGEPEVGRIAATARKRLRLMYEAMAEIGQTLDVARTAEELAEVALPEFADMVTVDLHDYVTSGQEPSPETMGLRRTAVKGMQQQTLSVAAGEPVHYLASSAQARCLSEEQTSRWPDPRNPGPETPWTVDLAPAAGFPAGVAVPLLAHGRVLGVATFLRAAPSGSFDDDELWLAEELASRTALSMDNARRFAREHAMVLALRRSMTPWDVPESSAVEVAHRCVPAMTGARGDWHDVIPLSGARVALVVGDVAGRDLHAAGAMARLRTTVGNFAALDMPPEDILGYLDDLVRSLDHGKAGEGERTDRTHGRATGTTCAYAVYDPTSQRCAIASAGHPAPAVVRPDGSVEFLDLPLGPPLGRGGSVFETAEVDLPEGSSLVLYTRGLIGESDGRKRRLRQALAGPGRTAEQTCAAVLDAVPPAHLADEFTLLVARTSATPADHVACWDVSPDPAMVAQVRAEVDRLLAAWDMEELGFSAELVFSELVTNAIRYGREPIKARLLLDNSLICEVSDAGETSPRPRRAADTDEGGRGLYLVAQLAERWGTRYTRRGKVIWAELSLTDRDRLIES
ncbi:SpoIIE family protein phosphatase [Nonomuraea sp. NPDC049714]|uniref:SpoIIE family protein phosphatase n=1 Tax=Nonomuraea sp. NPDC049714 TaxID=3364357 RepID=UPI0037B6500A